jgi:hypothetical protein
MLQASIDFTIYSAASKHGEKIVIRIYSFNYVLPIPLGAPFLRSAHRIDPQKYPGFAGEMVEFYNRSIIN